VREFWYGETAIDENERGVVFELAIRRPFHANELRGEHGGSAPWPEMTMAAGSGDGIIGSQRELGPEFGPARGRAASELQERGARRCFLFECSFI